MRFILLVVMALASYRAWRFIARDDWPPIKWARGEVERHTASGYLRPFILEFIECPWCLGAWLSLATVLVVDHYVGLEVPLVQWAAVSCLVGLIGRLDD